MGINRFVAATVLFGMVAASTAQSQITVTPFTNPHPVVSGGTIGFAYAGTSLSVQCREMD